MPPKTIQMQSRRADGSNEMWSLRKLVTSRAQGLNAKISDIDIKVQKIQASDELIAQIQKLKAMLYHEGRILTQEIPVAAQSLAVYQKIQEALTNVVPGFNKLYLEIDKAISQSVTAPQSGLLHVGSSVLVETSEASATSEDVGGGAFGFASQYMPVSHEHGVRAATEDVLGVAPLDVSYSYARYSVAAAAALPSDDVRDALSAMVMPQLTAFSPKGATVHSATPTPAPHPKPRASWEEAMKILNEAFAVVSSHLSEALASPNTQEVAVVFEDLMAAHEKAAALMGEQGQDS